MVSLPLIRLAEEISDEDRGERPERPEAKASPWVASRARRTFEFAVAGLALLLISPVMAVCWVLVRCSSPGPAFFKQRRMGRNGKEFELYKFRSMYCGRSDSGLNEPCEGDNGPSHTVHNDLRITPVGALLRRYKLDELPQFWNVLKGDMGLVGPRPKLPHHELLHMPYRPGITGEATLAFRHEERMLLEVPYDELDDFYDAVVKPIKAELDLRYMERATLLKDIGVLARTMTRCLSLSVDAQWELRELVRQYSPQHLERLMRQRIIVAADLRREALVGELSEEFAGDLDDGV